MQASRRLRPVLTVLATVLAGVALAASAGLDSEAPARPTAMPANGCPPSC